MFLSFEIAGKGSHKPIAGINMTDSIKTEIPLGQKGAVMPFLPQYKEDVSGGFNGSSLRFELNLTGSMKDNPIKDLKCSKTWNIK